MIGDSNFSNLENWKADENTTKLIKAKNNAGIKVTGKHKTEL